MWIITCGYTIIEEKKHIKRKNLKYYGSLPFTIHFHFAEIFPDFSGGLNFTNGSFKDISCGLNLEDRKLCGVLRRL